MTNQLNILIVGDAMGYPHGTGAASRVRNYAQGLMKAGATVEVACLVPTELSKATAINCVSCEDHRGIRFEYLCGSPIRSRSFVIRRVRKIQSAIRLAGRILRLRRRSGRERSAVLLYSDSPGWTAVTVLAARIGGVPVILDVCEFPSLTVSHRLLAHIRYRIQVRFLYRFVAGFSVISTFLREWLKEQGVSSGRIILIPPMIDLEEWGSASDIVETETHSIVYSGNLGHLDELRDLWAAFRIVAGINPGAVLRIIGGYSGDSAMNMLKDWAAEDGLSARLELMGWLPHERQRMELRKAAICVLPRRKGHFSTAGVPNKMAEYLASGRPIVASSVGDIPLYVRDGVSGILISPEEGHEKFAEAILRFLMQPDEARSAGREGRAVAETRLDTVRNGERLHEFIRGFCRSRSAEGS